MWCLKTSLIEGGNWVPQVYCTVVAKISWDNVRKVTSTHGGRHSERHITHTLLFFPNDILRHDSRNGSISF